MANELRMQINQDATLEKGGTRLQIDGSGNISSLKSCSTELVNRLLGVNHPRLILSRKHLLSCDKPQSWRRDDSRVTFQYAFSEPYVLSVKYQVGLLDLGSNSVALERKITVNSPGSVSEDIMVQLPGNIHLPVEARKVFLPLKNGVGRRKEIAALENDDEYLFQFAGKYVSGRPQILALPMVDEYSERTELHLTHCADPFFTSYFKLPFRANAR